MRKRLSRSLYAVMTTVIMLVILMSPFRAAATTESGSDAALPLCPPDCTILEQKFGTVNLGGIAEHTAPLNLGDYQFQLSDILDRIYCGEDFVAANFIENQMLITFSGPVYPKSVRLGLASYQSGPMKVTDRDLFYAVNGGERLVHVTSITDSFCDIKEPDGIQTIMLYNNPEPPIVWNCLEYIQIPEINKIMPAAPDAPAIESQSTDTVSLKVIADAEYSNDGTTWQTNPVFTNLTPGSEHTFYARFPETAIYFTSQAGPGTLVTLAKITQNPPGTPEVAAITADSVILQTVEGAEYSIDGSTWQTSPVFTGLEAATKYTFYACYQETETALASAVSPALVVQTEKKTLTAPNAPEVVSVTADAVTLKAIENVEFSIDGKTWQTSPVFTGLAPATEYTFFARYQETETAFASALSPVLVVQTEKMTQAVPDAPEVISVTADAVTLKVIEGAEYGIDGEIWQASPLFSGLEPATEYTFYVRLAGGSEAFASDSASIKVLTLNTMEINPKTGEDSAVNLLAIRVVLLISMLIMVARAFFMQRTQ